jgi:hypothetical protein
LLATAREPEVNFIERLYSLGSNSTQKNSSDAWHHFSLGMLLLRLVLQVRGNETGVVDVTSAPFMMMILTGSCNCWAFLRSILKKHPQVAKYFGLIKNL